jgi:GDP-L-fucose synthase
MNLVAGGSGFIGSNLVRRLLVDDQDVRATFYRHDPPDGCDDADWVQVDLTQQGACERIYENIDTVFLCAAVTSGASVIVNNPLAHVTDNIVLNARMLAAAHSKGVKRFVFLSSSAAYPPTGYRPTREFELYKGEPHRSYWWVGHMKRYAERLCYGYARKLSEGMRVTVIRPSNVYGPGDKFDLAHSHMCAAMIRRVVERRNPIEVWGTGKDVRDLIYVDDLIEGILSAVAQTSDYLAVNIASGTGYTVTQVLKTILDIDSYDDVQIVYRPDKPTTIPVRLVDTSLAKRALGFEAKTSLEDGLKRTISWYRERFV